MIHESLIHYYPCLGGPLLSPHDHLHEPHVPDGILPFVDRREDRPRDDEVPAAADTGKYHESLNVYVILNLISN